MHKIIKIVLIVLGLLGTLLWFLLPGSDVPASEASQNSAMNLMFVMTYVLLAIAIIASLLFALAKLFSSPESLKKTLLTLAGFVVVVVVAYVFASGSDVDIAGLAKNGIHTTEGTVKAIGAGLNVFLILTLVAVVLMVIPGVKGLFSK
ncbi:hypothetical protein K8352_12295 [Flavobacteriaceae bacterium F89]|jgi:membrane protease YdiL (CAAX protease family)|uniref:Uncharacterized protein n=1 Tax=Cerina litoralis TaxID=2874477 RepID=A0AAE3JRM8_9FLAO|nr:hypothetical protein [Cerina litoralis]MCG2461533.1 hypothetical protein [Cerina litoralis]